MLQQFQQSHILRTKEQNLEAIALALGIDSKASVDAPNIINGNAAETKDVLAKVDLDKDKYFYRGIQNTGATDIYVAVGVEAKANSYHRILSPGQEFNASRFNERISVYGEGAWTVATFVSKLNN